MRLYPKFPVLKGAVFPLAVFAFVGVGVEYANMIFTKETRWIFLALLGLVLLKNGRVFQLLNARFGIPTVLFFCWSLVTYIWSTVPELSLLKALASIFVTLVFVAAGRYWVTGWTSSPPLLYLVPVVVVAFISSVFGVAYGEGVNVYRSAPAEDQLYQGLTYNPNSLGILVASSFPLVLFFAFRAFNNRSALIYRVLTVIGVVILGLLIWRTASRSALLCLFGIIGFAVIAMRPTKAILLVALAAMIGAIIFVATPEFQDRVYTRLILKYSPNGDVFFTRRNVWQDSLEAASQGGWVGLGYGVSYGATHFAGGLSADTYGREKGNTQLAIVEETGIVGAALYAVLILTIIIELAGGLRRERNDEARMELALTCGLAVGLLLQSIFEAWWTAPGSAESAIFWATIGVASGLVRRGQLVRSAAAARPRPHFPLQGHPAART